MPAPFELSAYLLKNAMLFEILGLHRIDDDTKLVDGTLTMILYKTDGVTEVAGITFPLDFGYVGGQPTYSAGDWNVVVPGTADVAVGDKLLGRVTYEGAGPGLESEFDLPTKVKRRYK